ncbi:MAG: ATP-grasp domain-containing protein [Rhizomicrobium sp.]
MTARARPSPGKADDAAAAFADFKNAPSIMEAFIDFAFEASVVAARGQDGAFAAYDPPENLHEHHILRRSDRAGAAERGPGRGGQGHRAEDRRCARLCRRAGGGNCSC